MSIPLDANFKSLSCQLGGLQLNGIVDYSNQNPSPPITSGTAQSLTILSIDDPAVVQNPPPSPFAGTLMGYLQVKISGSNYYLPLYQ